MTDPLHDELQRHAGGLRDLARDLLRDVHAADDVVQAACAQALARPPAEPGPIGGWLHRTVVNFARQWQRGERRRSAREATVRASREPAPAVAEQLARRETLQAVTTAVLQLDEPYQTAIFLRYFEDLPPRAIAKRTGANVATVKSRLLRGLALLRTRLDHVHRAAGGDHRWRRALAATFGLPLGPLLPLPFGTLLVSTTTKTLFVAGALCAGGLLAWRLADDPALAPEAATPARGAAAAAVTTSALAPGDGAAARTDAAPVAAAPVPWLDHPFEVGLDVLVVDPLGLPVEGHTLRLAPFGCAHNDAERATGPDGRVSVSWRTRTRSFDVQVADPRGQIRRVTLQHGQRVQLVLLGRGKDAVEGRFRLALGTRVRGTSLELDKAVGNFFTTPVPQPGQVTMRAGLHPHAVFGDALASVPAEPAAGPDLVLSDNVEVVWNKAGNGLAFELGTTTRGLKFSDKATEGAAAGGAVDGVVFAADGKPAAKVPVHLFGAGPQPLQTSQTDDDGRFRFANLLPGEVRVRAGGDERGLASVPVVVTEGATPCTLNLQCGACVRGRAVDEAGKPRADHVVEWRALDGSWADATKTGKDGTFVIANVPAGPASVFLFDRSGNTSIPIATAPSVLPDTGELVLAAASGGSVLRLEPIVAGGERPRSVRLWHADTGLACSVPRPEQGAVWASAKLPAGFYDVEMRLDAGGTAQLGRHWLDGEHDFDLGRVEGDRGGTVRITIPPASLPTAPEQHAFELYSLRADADVRAELAPVPLDRVIRIAAGDYLLAWRHANGGVRFERFTVQRGAETVVAPAP